MKVLYVCSEFYAGLMPFGAAIINAMRGDDCYGIFVCSEKSDYRKAIIPNGNNYVFLDTPTDRLKTLLNSVYPKSLLANIKQHCEANGIEAIHLLTEDASLAYHLPQLKKIAKVYYTVHDLFFHEKIYKNVLSWLLRTVLVKMRVKYLIHNSENLVTCSKFQYEYMQKHFLRQRSYFHNFPTLVTESIITGKNLVRELAGVNNYILFFGQVEQYKGVDILYKTFIENQHRLSGKKLVIAGKGHIYFERDLTKESNVIIINRYIDDEEIKALFEGAYCAVFPYISATQSGILSIPYYFKLPTIVSNIPFFQEIILENISSISFDIGVPETMLDKIDQLAAGKDDTLRENGYSYYQKIYDQQALRKQLQLFYNSLN